MNIFNLSQQSINQSPKSCQKSFCESSQIFRGKDQQIIEHQLTPMRRKSLAKDIQQNQLQQQQHLSIDLKINNIKNLVSQSKNYYSAQRKFFTDNQQVRSNLNILENLGEEIKFDESCNAIVPNDLAVQDIYGIPERNMLPNFPQFKNESELSALSSPTANKKNKSNLGSFYKENNQILSNNKSQLNSAFKNKQSVVQVSFTYNKKNTDVFPKNYSFDPLQLQILELQFNSFKQIPFEVNNLKNLKTLRMDNNFIRVLPVEMFENLDLHILSLSNNLLQNVPDQMCSQQNLIYLDLSINRIEEISVQGICHLKSLKCLNINNNEFKFLPYEMQLLKNLKEIQLDWFKYCQPEIKQRVNNQELIQQFLSMFSDIHQSKILDSQRKKNNNEYDIESILELKQEGISFIDFVEFFSVNSFNINFKDHKYRSYAHLASLHEDIGVLISVLEYNFDLINTLDSEKNTPLSLALLQEKFFSSKTLLNIGAQVNIGGGYYGSCLNITTIKQQPYLIQNILKKGGDPNQTDEEGNSPLHYIMTIYSKDSKTSEKICSMLLRAGAIPNLKNRDGWCPLHLAAKKGQLEAFEYALRYNLHVASNDPKCKSFNINKRGGNQRLTPLHLASYNGYYQVVELLLQNDCDMFAKSTSNKTSADLSNRDSYISKMIVQKEQAYIRKHIINKQVNTSFANKESSQIKQNIHNKENLGNMVGRSVGSISQFRKNQQQSLQSKIVRKNNSNQMSLDLTWLDEESIDDEELDENKEIQEVMSQKMNMVNRQLTYVPNNIQQIEQFYSLKKEQHPLSPTLIKQNQEFSHQYISQVKHFLNKTVNVIDYYKTSLDKFSYGIESDLHEIHQKMKYLIIMMKLNLEFEQMIRVVNFDKNKIMEYNLNLCDDILLKDNLIHNGIMEKLGKVMINVKDKQNLSIQIIKSIVFYLFGEFGYNQSLDIMRDQINKVDCYVAYEAMQSISKLKHNIYNQFSHNSDRINNNGGNQQQERMQNIGQKNMVSTVGNMTEVNMTLMSFRDEECNVGAYKKSLSQSQQNQKNNNNKNKIHQSYNQEEIEEQDQNSGNNFEIYKSKDFSKGILEKLEEDEESKFGASNNFSVLQQQKLQNSDRFLNETNQNSSNQQEQQNHIIINNNLIQNQHINNNFELYDDNIEDDDLGIQQAFNNLKVETKNQVSESTTE